MRRVGLMEIVVVVANVEWRMLTGSVNDAMLALMKHEPSTNRKG